MRPARPNPPVFSRSSPWSPWSLWSLCQSCFVRLARATVLLAATAEFSAAQSRPTRRPPVLEGRIDAFVSSIEAIHVGAGLTFASGTYLRSGIVAGLGASRDGISGRVDIANRFHLDPFRQSRFAPYLGGGLTVRFDDDRAERTYLLLFAGVDGPVRGGVTTSVEAGLGGGGRIGVIIRRADAERR